MGVGDPMGESHVLGTSERAQTSILIALAYYIRDKNLKRIMLRMLKSEKYTIFNVDTNVFYLPVVL